MNTTELEQKLIAAGCSRANYSINERDSDVFCLMKIDDLWKVFYTERGLDQSPIFQSPSEEDACDFFFRYQTERIQHIHIVGYFKSQQAADELDAKLQALGFKTWQNPIPYHGWHDPRFRVFVFGRDIFKAQELLGNDLPLRDTPV